MPGSCDAPMVFDTKQITNTNISNITFSDCPLIVSTRPFDHLDYPRFKQHSIRTLLGDGVIGNINNST